MAKVRHLYPPLAKWTGARRVKLTLSNHVADALLTLLQEVIATGNVPLDTAANVGRRAAQTLAAEILKARPHLQYLEDGEPYSTKLPESQALSLLAWMLSSPTANQPTHDLRPLLDTLHQLLS